MMDTREPTFIHHDTTPLGGRDWSSAPSPNPDHVHHDTSEHHPSPDRLGQPVVPDWLQIDAV
jgi:hypothetical protein